MKQKIVVVFLMLLLIFTAAFPAVAENTANTAGMMSSMVQPNDQAGLLISLDTGDMLYQHNIDGKVYPASITKIMTVTLMLESDRFQPDGFLEMTDRVESYITGTGSAVSNLKVGETFTQTDLLHLVLMSSFGDCAYLAAMYYGDTVENFVRMMNEKAAALGLTGTHYGNPVGLHDELTYTTVRDIYTLTKYALQNPTFKTVCETNKYVMKATNYSGERHLSTTNLLMDPNSNCYYAYAAGVKTGFTDQAGRCLVSTATYKDMHYMCILMGCPKTGGYHFTDSAELYRTAFSNFTLRTVGSLDEMVGEMKVRLAKDTDHVGLYLKEGYPILMSANSDESTIRYELHPDHNSVDAPVKKGDILGTADIIYSGEVRGTVQIVAGEDVALSRWEQLLDIGKNFLQKAKTVLLTVLILVVILAVILFAVIYKMNHKKKRKIKYIPYNEDKE